MSTIQEALKRLRVNEKIEDEVDFSEIDDVEELEKEIKDSREDIRDLKNKLNKNYKELKDERSKDIIYKEFSDKIDSLKAELESISKEISDLYKEYGEHIKEEDPEADNDRVVTYEYDKVKDEFKNDIEPLIDDKYNQISEIQKDIKDTEAELDASLEGDSELVDFKNSNSKEINSFKEKERLKNLHVIRRNELGKEYFKEGLELFVKVVNDYNREDSRDCGNYELISTMGSLTNINKHEVSKDNLESHVVKENGEHYLWLTGLQFENFKEPEVYPEDDNDYVFMDTDSIYQAADIICDNFNKSSDKFELEFDDSDIEEEVECDKDGINNLQYAYFKMRDKK